MTKTIYIKLLNEGINVWRPVLALKTSGLNSYLISMENVVPDGETWEYPPGSNVLVTEKTIEKKAELVAYELVRINE